MTNDICKHDWVGDDACAYCALEEANEELATVREILADFDSEEVHVMAQRAIERIQELEARAVTPEPVCEHSTPEAHARWCQKCGALFDGAEWIYPAQRQNREVKP